MSLFQFRLEEDGDGNCSLPRVRFGVRQMQAVTSCARLGDGCLALAAA